ncbi:hypothetical protein WG907_06855 [Sphingobium sp. AN558]|uniref:hypothetical protein n=1 Tax=Sphingobium sp. AN558 TaxID=3133442 RepID=UPI0030BA5A1C
MVATPPEKVTNLLDRLREEEFERLVDERVAQRASRDAMLWRMRLITIEAIMMSGLILAAGLLLGKPMAVVAKAALGVGAACFASGMLLIGLSGLGGHCLRRLRGWISRS